MAGAVIGTGISLSIGLFYSSASALICTVILISSLMGALFGRVMARLLVDDDVGFVGHAAGRAQHQITGNINQPGELTDHKTLKTRINNNIVNHDVIEIINSMRTAGLLSKQPHPDPRFFDLPLMDPLSVHAGHGSKR